MKTTLRLGVMYTLIILAIVGFTFSCMSPQEQKEENFKQLQEQVEAQDAQNKEDSENVAIHTDENSSDTLLMREYQLELNSDNSVDIYQGKRYVGHLPYNKDEPFHQMILRDNE